MQGGHQAIGGPNPSLEGGLRVNRVEKRAEAVTLGNLSKHLQARGVAPARPKLLPLDEPVDEEV
jgi:hypothetical protein